MLDNIKACFKINEPKITACFKLNVTPDKVSQLQNDLNYQTDEQVAESIKTAIEPIQADIEDINTRMVDTVAGSDLIGVSQEDNTVTITSKTFVFEQGIPATEWIINHNLNKRPSIDLVNSNGERFEAYREYMNNNQVIIKLDAAGTGYAYLN